MRIYTCLEKVNDLRIKELAKWAGEHKATNLIIFCRPEHVAVDESKVKELADQAVKERATAKELAMASNYAGAAQREESAKSIDAAISKLRGEGTQWVRDMIGTYVPHEVMVVGAWPATSHWSAESFISMIPQINAQIFAGKFGFQPPPTFTPLTRRVYVPLEMFVAPAVEEDTVGATLEDKPKLDPGPRTGNASRDALLDKLSARQATFLVKAMGWDREDEPRIWHQIPAAMGESVRVVSQLKNEVTEKLAPGFIFDTEWKAALDKARKEQPVPV